MCNEKYYSFERHLSYIEMLKKKTLKISDGFNHSSLWMFMSECHQREKNLIISDSFQKRYFHGIAVTLNRNYVDVFRKTLYNQCVLLSNYFRNQVLIVFKHEISMMINKIRRRRKIIIDFFTGKFPHSTLGYGTSVYSCMILSQKSTSLIKESSVDSCQRNGSVPFISVTIFIFIYFYSTKYPKQSHMIRILLDLYEFNRVLKDHARGFAAMSVGYAYRSFIRFFFLMARQDRIRE